jgi:hypothetical protein
MDSELMVKGFLPSKNGFHFANLFQPVKYVFRILGLRISVGNASNGVCGGMIYTAVDYFLAGKSTPADCDAPSQGSLFEYLCQRLWDSFNIPFTPLRYYFLMTPILKIEDRAIRLGKVTLVFHGKGWRMAKREWLKVKDDIDHDRLSPIGIILKTSWNPNDVGHNHQVLVHGYQVENENVVLRLYDPNYPGDDSVSICFDLTQALQGMAAEYRMSGGKIADVTCFFRTRYRGTHDPLPI